MNIYRTSTSIVTVITSVAMESTEIHAGKRQWTLRVRTIVRRLKQESEDCSCSFLLRVT